jgi:hypothetical protein
MPQKRSVKPDNVDRTAAPVPELRLLEVIHYAYCTLGTINIETLDIIASNMVVNVRFDRKIE